MSPKLFLVFFLTIAYTEAQSNDVCPCESEVYHEGKKMLNTLLEKLSTKVSEEDKIVYSVYPGLLNEFECNCDEKQRKKRKTLLEQPEELDIEQSNPQPEEAVVVKRAMHETDRRCAKGSVRFGFTCIPVTDLDDY